MNEFCKNCIMRKVPLSIKKKYNDTYDKTFIECPTSDPKVVGCLIKKNLDINWNSFAVWLNDNGNLTQEEAMMLARAGLIQNGKK